MTAPAATTPDSAEIILQSPIKGLRIVLKMGETTWLGPTGARRHKTYGNGKMVDGLEFRGGVCQITKEKWESLGYDTREKMVAVLRDAQKKGINFILREDLEKVAGRAAPGTPPTVVAR